MRTERGGSRTHSFVLPTNITPHPHSNKENSGQSPLSRTYSGRRSRAVVTNAVGVVSRRHRAHTPRLPPAPVAQLNENMAAPNSELERPAERRITLPRRLSRPNNYRPIDLRIVGAIDPLLDNIPLIYIQHSLAEVGPRLLKVTRTATAIPPTGQLPRKMQIICNDISIDSPSHVLAVMDSNTSQRGITLFPTHALVLSANCALLPVLPESREQRPTAAGGTVTVPLIVLRIPSPATFQTLLNYLYTKRTDELIDELLPVHSDDKAASTDTLARMHAENCTVKALSECARNVYGLWGNASVLGIFDDKLYRSMEFVWEVLTSALTIKPGGIVVVGDR